MNATIPILTKNPSVLVIGGGSTARLKVHGILHNGVKVKLVAISISDEIKQLNIDYHERPFQPQDLHGINFVVDASGSTEVLNQLLELRSTFQFQLNCCAKQEFSDFQFCAQANYGPVKIAVSSNGGSPTMSRLIRDKITKFIPTEIEFLAQDLSQTRAQGQIDHKQTKEKCQSLLSQAYLIGCGPGDPDLLTLKAYKLIKQVDVVLYDHLVTDEILALIPQETEQIDVGKQKGCHKFHQQQINELLCEKVKQGFSVARLKSGDPYVFGRGSEEVEYLAEHNIRVEVINGISSAIAGPALANIPVTARGYATHFSVVSAHLAGDHFNVDWFPLLQIPNHTIVVLMGLSRAAEISAEALKIGIPETFPVAIIANASRPNQNVIISDLKSLPDAAQKAERPALLVFGEVVQLHQSLPIVEQTHNCAV
jgi:uroporphyrin-III C-methyltransferase/precorrin-2 dehydrogenase/sirohydrochlorin ferrochelatase